jgi:hypothetical protein
MRDLVSVHVMADLPIRARALLFADRVEIRFGNAFPVALLIDRAAVDRLVEAIKTGKAGLEAANSQNNQPDQE